MTKEFFMKSKGLALLTLSLLFLMGCGKENQSGRTNSWNFGNPYTSGLGTINSPFGVPYNGSNLMVNRVLQENPCVAGFGGYQGMGGTWGGQRIQIQQPLVNFPTVVSPGDVYVGVTSYGDVGVVAGTALGQPPVFVGYMCPRAFSQAGSGQLFDIGIGAYTQCAFKPLWKATMVLPGGETARFRMMDYGSSMRQKFSFCR